MHDSCPGCGYYDLGKSCIHSCTNFDVGCLLSCTDLSPAVFTEFEPESVGVLNGITWHFNA